MRREIKRLRELLVRHGNRADILKNFRFPFFGITRKQMEADRRKTWKKLMAADPELLRIAAEELNEREQEWRRP